MNKNYDKRRGAGWIRLLYYLTRWSWLKRFGWHPEEENIKTTTLLADDSDSRIAQTMHEDESEHDIELSHEDLEKLLSMGISMRPPPEFFLESPERLRDLKRIFKFILEHEEEIQQERANEAHDSTE